MESELWYAFGEDPDGLHWNGDTTGINVSDNKHWAWSPTRGNPFATLLVCAAAVVQADQLKAKAPRVFSRAKVWEAARWT